MGRKRLAADGDDHPGQEKGLRSHWVLGPSNHLADRQHIAEQEHPGCSQRIQSFPDGLLPPGFHVRHVRRRPRDDERCTPAPPYYKKGKRGQGSALITGAQSVVCGVWASVWSSAPLVQQTHTRGKAPHALPNGSVQKSKRSLPGKPCLYAMA